MPHESKSQSEEGHSQQHHAQGQEKKDKKREYSEAELQRLRESMRQEASKIHKPKRKLYAPYTFNGLDPYMDLTTAEFVHEMPTDVRHGYASRHLAIGLCDPPVALRMDVNIPAKTQPTPRAGQQEHRKQKTKDDKERPAPEGSTRLPQFPAVRISMANVPKKKQYDVNDVPVLRHAVNEQCSPRSSRRVEDDYKRTKADFYRMELDKMDEYGPVNRTHMKAAYFAYLQNTAGSRKALRECVRSVDDDNEKDNHDDRDQQLGDKKEHRHKEDKESSAKEKDGKRDDEEKESGEKSAEEKEEGAERKNEKERQRKREGREKETHNGKKRDSIKSRSENDSDSDERENKTTSSTRKNKQSSVATKKNK